MIICYSLTAGAGGKEEEEEACVSDVEWMIDIPSRRRLDVSTFTQQHFVFIVYYYSI
jgi:hypothetical protein